MPNLFSKLFNPGAQKKEAIEALIQQIYLGNFREIDIENFLSSRSLTKETIERDLISLLESYIRDFFKPNLTKEQYRKVNKDLVDLRAVLGLRNDVGEEAREHFCVEYFRDFVTGILSDGVYNDEKKQSIEEFQNAIKINPYRAEAIVDQIRRAVVQAYFNSLISDRRISPEEMQKLDSLSKSLAVSVGFDQTARGLIDRFSLLWRIENNEIPIIVNPGIILQRQEECYYIVQVGWYETRKQTSGVNYGGLTYRKRIAGGLYFRAGSLGIKPISQDILTKIDQGSVYLTNKRMIFTGAKGNKTIAFNSIIDIQPFANGVLIERSTGKSPFLEFEDDVEIFSTILNQILTA